MGFFDKLDKPVFLKEESDMAIYIEKLNGLMDRASGSVKEKIEKEIKLASWGIVGEQNIAFELKNSGIPMYVLHDIHLEAGDLSAQIDYLVVTRRLTFVIECKNMIGDIEIDNNGGFIRSYQWNGKHIREGIYSPITQNQRHLDILKLIKKESKGNVLTKLLVEKLFDDNYKSVVVLANPKTILNAKYAKHDVKEKVIRADQLIRYIKEVNKVANIAESNDKELLERAEKLMKLHVPCGSDYIKKFEELVDAMSELKGAISEDEKIVDLSNDNSQIDENDVLIRKLKEFRLKRSREENIKPYFIFNDKQMMDLICKAPRSVIELQNVSGFGQVKAEKYGEVIIKILSEV